MQVRTDLSFYITLGLVVLLFATLLLAAVEYFSGKQRKLADIAARYALFIVGSIAVVAGCLRLAEKILSTSILPIAEAEHMGFTLLLMLFGLLTLTLVKFPEKFDDARTEAAKLHHGMSSLKEGITQRMFDLERSMDEGLLATPLDPGNVWQRVLDDARHAKTDIKVAITVPDFAAPREWDEVLATYLSDRKADSDGEIHYTVAIYRHPEHLTPDAIDRLKAINNIYRAKGLTQVVHGFVPQTQYFGFSIIIIDKTGVGFLWNSQGGPTSTKGIYFRNAPKLASELSEWFHRTCGPSLVDAHSTAPQDAAP